MRARVALILVTALAAATAATPALAVKRRVPVPILHCYIYVETQDLHVGANSYGVRVARYGQNEVSSDC